MLHRRVPYIATALCLALGLLSGTGYAATPPTRVNYQGVLRDAADRPLSGTYDMTFRFMDAATGGSMVLTDQHAASSGNPVTVAGGLFNVALGSGTISGGGTPPGYTSLDAVFRDYGSVWLEVQVGAETLAPRTPIQSAAYALNSTNAVSAATAGNATLLNAQPSSFYLDTSSTREIKSGSLRLQSSDPTYAALDAVCTSGSSGYGVWSDGCTRVGGYFDAHLSTGGLGVYAIGGDKGIFAYGNVGALIQDNPAHNQAYLGDGAPDDAGIAATGYLRGGYFADPWGDYGDFSFATSIQYGVWAHGYHIGGHFENAYSGTYGDVAHYLASTIRGNGSKDFVQNHPEQNDRTIEYSSLEGDEVGTYTRGSARLVKGEARVALGATYQWVTNPELGLTVYVTPMGGASRLYVASKSTKEIVVRSAPGDPDVSFDYIVVGLRVGFEDANVVREKDSPAPVPSMAGLKEQQSHHPELLASTPRSRFVAMERSAGRTPAASYPKADALLAKINAADHGVTESRDAAAARLARFDGDANAQGIAAARPQALPISVPVAPRATASQASPSRGEPSRVPPATVVAAPSELAAIEPPVVEPVVEPVEAGDLLVLDPTQPGRLRRGSSPDDPNVVGIAAAASVATDDGLTVALVATNYAEVKVDATLGAIRPGDLLVASPTPGHAMVRRNPVPGTVIGKALAGLETGTGIIRVLVMSR